MDENIEEIRSSGLKVTVPRLQILQLFEQSEERHLTADDVFQRLKEDGSDIGLATVYRVLAQFEQAGLLARNYFDSQKAVYELSDDGHHDHIICLDCGRVEEFFDAELERQKDKIARARGFRVEDHTLNLYCRCIRDDCPHRE